MKIIRSTTGRFAAASFSLLVILSLAANAQAQQIGYVLDMSGDWFLNGDTRLTKTARLPGDGVIRSGSPSDISSFIVVANRAGTIIARRACNRRGECDSAIQLPSYKEPSVVKGFFEKAMEWWNGSPDKVVTPASKGTDLNEAVVKLEKNVLNMSKIFNDMEAGSYYLRFERLDQANTAGQSVGPIAFKWDPAHPAPLGVCDLKIGLYRLSLLEPQGETFNEIGADAWILISDPAQYDSASSSFGEAVKLTEEWGKQVKPNTARSFLRVNLDLLATQPR